MNNNNMKGKYMKHIATVVMVVLIIFSLGSCSRMHMHNNTDGSDDVEKQNNALTLAPSSENSANDNVEDELDITNKILSILDEAIAIIGDNDRIKWNKYITTGIGFVAAFPWLSAAIQAVIKTSIVPLSTFA